MKLSTLVASISLLIFSIASFAHEDGASPAKAIELSAHRIEKLVYLNKIDASFKKKLETLEVAITGPAPLYYKVRATQTLPADGSKPNQVDFSFDEDGNSLAYQVVAGGNAGVDPAWPSKDPVALTENAMHYVLENATDAAIEPFAKGATTFILGKDTLNGQTVAKAILSSSLTNNKLYIYQKLDGTFISANVAP